MGRRRQETSKAAYKPAIAAFTLIELLVVIALSALLLALLLTPLVKAFQFTNRAKALVEAQDATRFTIENLKREIASAAYVYDNSRTPLVLPLGPSDTSKDNGRLNAYPGVYPGGNPRPTILYGLIDLLPVATVGQGGNTPIDPTTKQPVGGTPVVLPGSASGRRMVRYFVGLRNNLPASGQTDAFYQNVYEFPRSDGTMNTFILYRAEFDPQDPNLVNPDATDAYAVGQGGLHDPNFFYNLSAASGASGNKQGNGRSYAANWRAIASPILASTNMDVLAWRRSNGQNNGTILSGSPFQMNVGFTPSAVVGDTATPGFLSNAAAETPGAVPSVYAAKFGQWTLPYSATFFRAPSRGSATSDFGSVRFTIRLQANNGVNENIVVEKSNESGIFTSSQPYYWLYDVATGKFIIHTANLTFQMDPARGKIETAFAPIATTNGLLLYRPSTNYAVPDANVLPKQLVAASTGDNFTDHMGVLVTTLYREVTRSDSRAGTNYGDAAVPKYVPDNQGIIISQLAATAYYDTTSSSYQNPTGTAYPSPFSVFGNNGTTNPSGGVLIVAGSDKIFGPDNNLSRMPTSGNATPDPEVNSAPVQYVTYFRVPALSGSISKTASVEGDAGSTGRRYVRNGLLNYRLENDLAAYNTPYVQFDEGRLGFVALDPSTYSVLQDQAAGLPATMNAQGNYRPEVLISYLWQDNYARNQAGEPLTATGQSVTGNPSDRNTPRPEADVVKVDYSTRSQINVVLGARVFDTSSGTPQTAQVTDKVVVTNANR